VILITGATGYVGSHLWVDLIKAGYKVFGIDNLSNSKISVLNRIEKICGIKPFFESIDLKNYQQLQELFSVYHFDMVFHLAGEKSVSGSVINPLYTYNNNILSLLNLLNVMQAMSCKSLIFSSSATVYDQINLAPYNESMSVRSENPYGTSKLICEKFLKDLHVSDSNWKIIILRYFNPIGAHVSGLIGEDPLINCSNIMPTLAKVATGELDFFPIYGNNYPTKDGTPIRDYVHIADVTSGHLSALNYFEDVSSCYEIINLGRGEGVSVLKLLQTYEMVCSSKIPYRYMPRRMGDVAISYADVKLASRMLDWKSRYTLEEMCRDFLRWQTNKIT
jgi:UDP-glucose 4-epimerase